MPGDDPKTVWQDQKTEELDMTIEQIKKKARQLHGRTRNELLRSTGVAAFAIVLSAVGIAWVHDFWPRVIFALAITWVLAGQYFIQRRMWPVPVPGDSALDTGLKYYRREIERRRRLFGQILQWSFGPVALALCGLILALFTLGTGPVQSTLVKMFPFLAANLIWVGAIFKIRLRQQRELQREIEELNRVEG